MLKKEKKNNIALLKIALLSSLVPPSPSWISLSIFIFSSFPSSLSLSVTLQYPSSPSLARSPSLIPSLFPYLTFPFLFLAIFCSSSLLFFFSPTPPPDISALFQPGEHSVQVSFKGVFGAVGADGWVDRVLSLTLSSHCSHCTQSNLHPLTASVDSSHEQKVTLYATSEANLGFFSFSFLSRISTN